MGNLGCKLLNEYGYLGINTGFECLVVFLWLAMGIPTLCLGGSRFWCTASSFGEACVRFVS